MELENWKITVLSEEEGVPPFLCDECNYESLQEAILMGILGQCGCGCPEEQAKLIHSSLNILDRPIEYRRSSGIYNWGTQNGWDFFLHWANEKRLTDHGAGIGGSWLNEKGYFVRNALAWTIEDC